MTPKRELELLTAIGKAFYLDQDNGTCLNIPEQDMVDATVDTADSLNTRTLFYSGHNRLAGFIGDRKICLKLKEELNGIVRRRGSRWLWLGRNPNKRASEIINEFVRVEKATKEKREALSEAAKKRWARELDQIYGK